MKHFFQKILQKLPVELIVIFGFLLLGMLLIFLNRLSVIEAFYVLFVVFGIVYIAILKPHMDEKRDRDIFDAKVLAYLNALSRQLPACGVCAGDLESFVRQQLRHHRLNPEEPVECTAPNGMWYGAVGRSDYPLFAIICIIRFAESYGNEPLLSWAQDQLAPVRGDLIHHRW